jgi:hypothetical protein
VCWYISPIPVNGSATSYQRFLWGSTGDGTFTNPDSLITAYIPGIKDKTSGGTDLKLIVWPLAPCLNKATSMMHITLDPCTGIHENPVAGVTLAIQPNPVHDKLSFTVTGLKNQAVVTIAAPEGRLIYSGIIEPSGKQSNTTELNSASWPKGMYLLQLQSDEKITVTRFIVQ